MPAEFGCEISPVDLRDYKLDKQLVNKVNFPESFDAMKVHIVKHQGSVSSCVPHAVSSILEFHDNYRDTLSTNFIYGLKKLYGQTGKGEHIRVALDIVRKYGDPQMSLCSGNTEVDKVFEIANKAYNDEEVMEDAYRHKIKSYVKLNDIKDIKYALMNYGPVVVSIKWYTDIIFNEDTRMIDTNRETIKNYHAVIIYGWDESGWMCQNSWGNKWGWHGLFKLPFDYDIEEAYGLIDDETLSSDNPEVVRPVHGSKLLELLLKIISKLINLVLGR